MLQKLLSGLLILVSSSQWIPVGGLLAQEADVTIVFAADTLNIRECPGRECSVVASVSQGTELILAEPEIAQDMANTNAWFKVALSDSAIEGYVHSSLTTAYHPNSWQGMPVTPRISAAMLDVYRRGLAMGNNPQAFSIVGDCQNVSAYFLSDFEKPLQYDLGEHESLQETIDFFYGSFARDRAAVRGGYNVAAVLSPMWADPEQCEKGESPLACEYRLQQPSFVLISMETWWEGQPVSTYEQYLRQVVEFWIDHGVVPILATKADNVEGDHSINTTIVRVAQDYDVPLWNFWRAVQPLPNHGLSDDEFHLTYGRPFFGDDGVMQTGWALRNLTALEALDSVRRGTLEIGAS